MDLDNLQVFLSFLGSILGLLFTTIIFLKKFIKNKKLKNILEKAEQITKELVPCIIEAEQFVNYTGEEKKNYVMTKVNQFAIDNDITFDPEYVSSKVEQLISLTKEVNCSRSKSDNASEVSTQIKNLISGLRG